MATLEYAFRFPLDVSNNVVFVSKVRLTKGLDIVDL
jgi:hypothetical protein